MTQTTGGHTIELGCADDYLGPGATRFFSTGYRRVHYDFDDVAVTDITASTTGRLTYPADWSRKTASSDLRPHLSTVDSLVLGVQLAECYLAHTHQLNLAQQRTSTLRHVLLRAGTTPQEDLDRVPLSAKLRDTEVLPNRPGRAVSSFDCASGVMRARCTIEHDLNARVSPKTSQYGRYPTVESLLGPAGDRYYGDGFKTRRQSIENVSVDLGALHAQATAAIHQLPGTSIPTAGTDGAHQPLVTPVDCFVITLQLAQILMYELDNIRRENTNTLWMLRTALDATASHTTAETPGTEPTESAVATIVGSHLLPLRGAQWRNVDIKGSFGGIAQRCTFAHKLPA